MKSTTNTTPLTILVTGGTGNQGGAVINALLASPFAHNYTILALTRSTTSPKATALAAKSSQLTLVKGDLDDAPALSKIIQDHKVTTVYSVQNNYFGSPSKHLIEETQAKGLIDAAVAHGVRHFVQSTGDRGGPTKSNTTPTPVPHFQTKYNIEKHLIAKCAQSTSTTPMTYTILRPASFMDNLTPDLHGKGYAAMWHCMGTRKPLQLISARDIGLVAARAIASPLNPDFHNAALSLAGDELTQPAADGVFRKVFQGKPMPRTLALVGTMVKWTTPEIKAMFQWFEEEGFGADVDACRQIEPALLTLEDWLRGECAFGVHGG